MARAQSTPNGRAATGSRCSISSENLGKPVVAAINGFALGGGCETAMACTIRIAVERAKFGQPEVKLGLLPGGGGTQRLPRLVGKGRALQLILSGGMIGAQEAYRIGLVNEVVPTADLIARSEAILNEIVANAPLAVRYALDAVNKGMEASQAEGLARSLLLRAVRWNGGQEGRYLGIPPEARTAISRAVNARRSSRR